MCWVISSSFFTFFQTYIFEFKFDSWWQACPRVFIYLFFWIMVTTYWMTYQELKVWRKYENNSAVHRELGSRYSLYAWEPGEFFQQKAVELSCDTRESQLPVAHMCLRLRGVSTPQCACVSPVSRHSFEILPGKFGKNINCSKEPCMRWGEAVRWKYKSWKSCQAIPLH